MCFENIIVQGDFGAVRKSWKKVKRRAHVENCRLYYRGTSTRVEGASDARLVDSIYMTKASEQLCEVNFFLIFERAASCVLVII